MRILFTMAHYWRRPTLAEKAAAVAGKLSQGKVQRYVRAMVPRFGSVQNDPASVVRSFTECISHIHALFGPGQFIADREPESARRTNPVTAAELKIIVCCAKKLNILDRVELDGSSYEVHYSAGSPRHMSFECQEILQQHLGQFDYYCFIEHDTIFHDPWFFRKQEWFNRLFGDDCVLQPNRFDPLIARGPVRKVYGDEIIRREVTAAFQDITRDAELQAEYLGAPLRFNRCANPHAGCYFLNARQMARWAQQPDFGKPSDAFVTVFESGATLGLMKHFKVYKPALDNGNFLEVEHMSGKAFDLQRFKQRCHNYKFAEQ